MRAWRVMAMLLAIVGVVMLASSGLGTRFGLWPYRTGLSLLRYSAYVGVIALVVGVPALLLARARGGQRVALVLSVLLAAATFGVPYRLSQSAKGVPPIHDITTDTQDPPVFVAVLPLRAAATNSAKYAGDSIAALQRAAYPDVQPIMLSDSPPQAYTRALAAANAMQWSIVAADSLEGRIEATATTTWFGFKDDVVVRIRGADQGSRIDVRSVSRVGRSDVGANAARIRSYARELSRSR